MESHLLQMRGLKHRWILKKQLSYHHVASFTDAWIETPFKFNLIRLLRRIFYRCVD